MIEEREPPAPNGVEPTLPAGKGRDFPTMLVRWCIYSKGGQVQPERWADTVQPPAGVRLEASLEADRRAVTTLRNLLGVTESCILFLDSGLRLTFFTPAAERLFRIIPSDVGRPIGGIIGAAFDHHLAEDAQAVLTGTARHRHREIDGAAHEVYMRRVLPRFSEDNKIDGVILSYADRSVATEADGSEAVTRDVAAHIANSVRHPMAALDGALRVKVMNDAFRERFAASAASGRLEPEELGPAPSGVFWCAEGLLAEAATSLSQRVAEMQVEQPGRDRSCLRLTAAGSSSTPWLILELLPVDQHAPSDSDHALLVEDMSAVLRQMQQPLQTLQSARRSLMDDAARPDGQDPFANISQCIAAVSGLLQSLQQAVAPAAVVAGGPGHCGSIAELFDVLDEEFRYHASVNGFTLRLVRSTATIACDPARLEHLLRTILFQVGMPAVGRGKMLLGCRKMPGAVRLDLWIRPSAAMDGATADAPSADLPSDLKKRIMQLGTASGCSTVLHPSGSAGPTARITVPSADASARAPSPAMTSTLGDTAERSHDLADGSARENRTAGIDASRSAPKQTAAASRPLTRRQREVMRLVVDGHSNKEIAARLLLSQRTVENHRAQIMKRTRCTSLPALVRMAMALEDQEEKPAKRSRPVLEESSWRTEHLTDPTGFSDAEA